MVVQPGQDRNGNDGTGSLDRPTQGRVLTQKQGSTDRPELARQGSPICGVLEFSPRGPRRRHHRLRRDRLHCVPSAKPGLERARSAAQRCRGGNVA